MEEEWTTKQLTYTQPCAGIVQNEKWATSTARTAVNQLATERVTASPIASNGCESGQSEMSSVWATLCHISMWPLSVPEALSETHVTV